MKVIKRSNDIHANILILNFSAIIIEMILYTCTWYSQQKMLNICQRKNSRKFRSNKWIKPIKKKPANLKNWHYKDLYS